MKKILALTLALIALLSLLPVAQAAKTEAAEEHIALPSGVSAEQLTAEYWLGKKNKQAAHSDKLIMTAHDIADINAQNADMISIGDISCALTDIPESVPGDIVRALVTLAQTPENPQSRYLNGAPTDTAYWEALCANTAPDAVPDTVTVQYGYSVRRASLRLFPTNDFVGGTPTDRLYDKLVMSEFLPYLPLVVLHESADGGWCYVMLYGFGGWIEKENLALCESRADWLQRMQPERFLTVTARDITLADEPYCPAISALRLPMGTRLPLAEEVAAAEPINSRRSYGCYVVSLPTRGENGYIKDELALIPAGEDVCVGCLPFTRENIVKLAFKHLGARYGWAGMYSSNDCSGIVHEVFACFGFELPRTAGAIMAVDGFEKLDFSGMDAAQKLKALDGIPAGSLLGFPGHIMLYLGKADDKAYVISAVGSFGAADADGNYDFSVNSVTVNSLADTKRRTGGLWLDSLATALIIK